MKYIKFFNIFESIENLPPVTSVEDYVNRLRISELDKQKYIDWWDENYSEYKIYFFEFNNPNPIAGGIIDEDKIAINRKIPFPPHITLFLPIHEATHLKQHSEGRFHKGYFETVVNGDREGFSSAYKQLEAEANDVAISAMREMNIFRSILALEEGMLRSNENIANIIYPMMREDIIKYKPIDMFDLIRKQIL